MGTTKYHERLKLFEEHRQYLTAEKNYAGQQAYINEHLAERYGIEDIGNVPPERLVDLSIKMILALQDEAAELLAELPWKPWKDGCGDAALVDVTAARLEIVDLAMFVNNLVMMYFEDHAQFHAYFAAKLEENVRRQQDGYTYGLEEATNDDAEALASALEGAE